MKRRGSGNRKAAALIITMMAMAVLVSMSYVTVSKLLSRERRHNYIVNYMKANYACDSATRYAENRFNNSVDLDLKSRRYLPDFSDLFMQDTEQYQFMLSQFAESLAQRKSERYEHYVQTGEFEIETARGETELLIDELINEGKGSSGEFAESSGDSSLSTNAAKARTLASAVDPSKLSVPGPYGPKWPNIIEPVEMELSEAEIKITIEDENAKYPVVWALSNKKGNTRETEASTQIFTEWMGMDEQTRKSFFESLEQAREVKPFQIDMDPGYVTKKEKFKTRSVVRDKDGKRKSVFKTRYRTRRVPRGQNSLYMDFMYVLKGHLDIQRLKQNYISDEYRNENIAKYLGLWGTKRVNVNTAPRQVLEALFVYGGDEVDLADAVIAERYQEPFRSFDDLRDRLYSYADSLDKVEDRVLCRSICWSVHIEAVSGNASARSTTAFMRDKKRYVKIATVYE
ncbi:type II secretion system protein GspK [Sedimentisphaera salicampi]|uniref:Type II secretory pathway, component PulK n=1 Tax=Sedimentisphaera salicampi TaxID=1941349 RepID=A0A1W6LPY6_9BACT|nr:type II secretion system protein GspK [Sedimentisphaera salicampi]ARN57834.1 Type II secretory pathway, component PulK [Sedimentisphaera salicampi]